MSCFSSVNHCEKERFVDGACTSTDVRFPPNRGAGNGAEAGGCHLVMMDGRLGCGPKLVDTISECSNNVSAIAKVFMKFPSLPKK